jgi:hypothetical protein
MCFHLITFLNEFAPHRVGIVAASLGRLAALLFEGFLKEKESGVIGSDRGSML